MARVCERHEHEVRGGSGVGGEEGKSEGEGEPLRQN